MAISKGRALSATVNSASSIIKSSIDGTATIATLEQSAQQYANAAALPSVGNTFGEMALVQSTNRMYVWNGSGWYNVALINTNPSFTTPPDANYAFDDDSPRSNITITVAATDPESLGVSFSFETGGSMDSMASVTQDSSVFTLAPKGNDSLIEGTTLTGSLTIKASDGVNIVPAVSSFTLSFILTISNTSGDRLLLKADGTGNNTTPTDASTSNHSLTVAGGATLGTFSPFRHGGYSHLFDGSGDYLRDDTIADAFETGAGYCDNFTIEMWIWNNDATSDSNYVIGSNNLANGANDFILGTRKVFWNNAELADYGDARTNQYEWFHLVCVHEHDPSTTNNDTVSVWINGRRTGRHTGLNRISFANNAFAFGTEADSANFGSLGNYHNGSIHDVKISKVALYGDTAVIPVPTAPSTPHETANIFHGFQKGFIDPRFTIGGNVAIDPWTPLDYSVYKDENGGSVFFDGSGDYLQLQDNADFDLPGEFSYEFWLYRTGSTSGTYQAILGSNGSGSNGLTFYITQSNGALNVYQSSFVISGSAGDITDNSWHHVLLMRDSSNLLQLFINGVRVSSSTNNTAFTDNTAGGGTRIGYDISANGYFKGFLTNIRLVKGSTGGYSSGANITVPTAPLTAVTNTKLLLNFTQAKIIDKSQNRNIPITGNVVASSAQQHYGENTLAFDGNGDRIKIATAIPLSDDIDWTVETWVRSPSAEGSRVDLISQYEASPAAGRMGIYFLNKKLAFFQSNLSPTSVVGTTDVVNNQWHHVAVTNHVGTRRIYLDGNFEGSTSGTGHMLNTDTVIGDLGDGASNGAELNGYLHDLRITQDLVRYPYIAKPKILSQTNSGMEKPGGSFPTVSSASNTLFLIGHTNSIVDGSSNNTSITTHGNTQMSAGLLPQGAETGMASIHFDGTGDYLSATTASALGTGDWTVEYWVWHDEFGSNQIHLAFGTYAPAFYYRHSSSTFKFSFYQTGAGLSSNVWTTYAPTPNKWYHLAWVHDDSENKLALFVNGAFWGDVTYTGNTTSTSLRVGDDTTSAWMNGNISNLRIVKEKLYTHNFTPRTSAIQA